MTDADPDEHAPGEVALEFRVLARELGRVVRPHVRDPRRDDHPLAALEQRPQTAQPRRRTEPERPVPELLGEARRLAGVLLADPAVRRPDSELAELHHT